MPSISIKVQPPVPDQGPEEPQPTTPSGNLADRGPEDDHKTTDVNKSTDPSCEDDSNPTTAIDELTDESTTNLENSTGVTASADTTVL